MKLPSLFAFVLLAAVSTAPVQAAEAKAAFKADAAKGGTLATACQACHVADGSRGAPANPILQGQHPEYLVKQLTEFKSGKRANAVMKGMATPLSEDDMKHIAAFYAGKQAKPGFAKNKDTITLGEKIYRGGIADRNIPPAPAATARMAPAFRPSTRAWAASTPTTPRRNWWPSAPACATTAPR